MDAECYFAEKMMRDRIAEVRANAELARLLRESNEHSRRYVVGGRPIETGRWLAKTARKVALAMSRALSNGTHVAKHPQARDVER